jgi:hypothetical protein
MDLDHCHVCGNELPSLIKEWAHQRFEEKTCSIECEQIASLRDYLRNAATTKDGIIRWNANGSVPPIECVALAVDIGLPVNVEACNKARDADNAAFCAEYKGSTAEKRSRAWSRRHACK